MVQWKKTDYPGVRFREHSTRKHGVKYDRYFVITYKYNKKTKTEALGWASQGVTAKGCYDLLSELKRNRMAGEGAQTLKEKRQFAQNERVKIEALGSVERLFMGYCAHLRAEKKASAYEVERALLKSIRTSPAVEVLGADKSAFEVSSSDIQSYLKSIHLRAPSMAAHMRAYLYAAFQWGIAREYDYVRSDYDLKFGIAINPVAAVPRHANAFKVGDRVLNESELRLIWGKMRKYSQSTTELAIKLILAVGGQRVREVVEAKCSEFNVSERLWVIPKERSKNKREHVVPLSGLSVSLIEPLMQEDGYLFEGRIKGRPLVFTALNKAVSRMNESERIDRWSPRDLRRTCRTMMADIGEPPYLLNWHFNHGLNGVGEKHYDRSNHFEEKRKLMLRWEKRLMQVLEGSL